MATTVRQVILARLAESGVTLSGVTLDALLIDADLGEGAAVYTKAEAEPVRKILLSAYETMLAQADVAEGDLSIKFDRTAIQALCRKLETELGLGVPTVTDRSNVW